MRVEQGKRREGKRVTMTMAGPVRQPDTNTFALTTLQGVLISVLSFFKERMYTSTKHVSGNFGLNSFFNFQLCGLELRIAILKVKGNSIVTSKYPNATEHP